MRRNVASRLAFMLALVIGGAMPTVTQAGEAYYLLMFSYQRIPNNPDYSHTFATFVRATWEGPGPCADQAHLEVQTISWLPVTGVVRTLAREPEPGRNYTLDETLQMAVKDEARISLWGPFSIEKELYCRALKRIAFLNSGRLAYKANDSGYEAQEVSNCIHGVTGLIDNQRIRLGSPGWGDVASFVVLQRLRPWIREKSPHRWVGARLGLDAYPIVYREGFSGPPTGIFAGVLNRILPERGLQATYGPPR